MPMSHQTVPLARPDLESLSESKRERLESRLRRGKALRLAFIVALFLVFGSLFTAFSIRVGTHLVAAWWFESHHCIVVWDVDETNWSKGGATAVSNVSRNSWNATITVISITSGGFFAWSSSSLRNAIRSQPRDWPSLAGSTSWPN